MTKTMKIPEKHLKNTKCSQIIMGCNPFIGWSYLGKSAASKYKTQFSTPEPIADILVHAYQYGINTIMTTADQNVIAAITQAEKEAGDINVMGMLGYSIEGYRNFKEDIEEFSKIGVSIAVIVAEITDPLIKKTPMMFDAYVSEVSKTFDTIGAATHNPVLSFEYLETTGVDFLVAAVNPKGFMMGKKEKSYSLITSCSKPVVAKKVLAAGRLDPHTGFDYAFKAGITFAVVGMASKKEVDQDVEAFNSSINSM